MILRRKSDINKCLKLQIIRRLGDLLSPGSTCGEMCSRIVVTNGRRLAKDHPRIISIEYSIISSWTMQKRTDHFTARWL